MRGKSWIVLSSPAVVQGLILGPALAQDKPQDTDESAWAEAGALGEAGQKIAPLFSWDFDGRGFRFGPATWDAACAELDPSIFARVDANGFFQHVKKFHVMSDERAKIFRQVYSLATRLSLPQSSVSSSGGSISVSTKSDALEVSVSWDGETARSICRERRAPRRGLEITRREDHFSMALSTGDKKDRFVFESRAGMACLKVLRGGKVVRNLSAPDFFKLYLDQRGFFEDVVFPTFARFGAPRPALPMDPEALKEVLRYLRPPPEAARERVAALLRDLRSPDLAVREEATGALARGYPAFESAIHEALRDKNLPPEERFRLSLLTNRVGGRAEAVRQLLKRGQLLKHPEFRRLLIEAAEPDERAELRRRIEVKKKRFF